MDSTDAAARRIQRLFKKRREQQGHHQRAARRGSASDGKHLSADSRACYGSAELSAAVRQPPASAEVMAGAAIKIQRL